MPSLVLKCLRSPGAACGVQGVVCAMAAQQGGSPSLVQEAEQCFDAVGSSETEADTIPGKSEPQPSSPSGPMGRGLHVPTWLMAVHCHRLF